MSPLVRAGIAAAVVAVIAASAKTEVAPVFVDPKNSGGPLPVASLLVPCPPGTLLDNQVCVPAPSPSASVAGVNAVRNWQVYDRLPRRPDRPANHRRYHWPVESPTSFEASPFLSEGAVAGDALLLEVPPGTPVVSVPLDHQKGDAAVLYVGKLVGDSIVTEHRVTEARREQVYIVVLGNVSAPSTRAGRTLKPGETVGKVAATRANGVAGLHLEVRRVRHEVDAKTLGPEQLRNRAYTIACDPRNVFQAGAQGDQQTDH